MKLNGYSDSIHLSDGSRPHGHSQGVCGQNDLQHAHDARVAGSIGDRQRLKTDLRLGA
jgi:hypothetical protein